MSASVGWYFHWGRICFQAHLCGYCQCSVHYKIFNCLLCFLTGYQLEAALSYLPSRLFLKTAPQKKASFIRLSKKGEPESTRKTKALVFMTWFWKWHLLHFTVFYLLNTSHFFRHTFKGKWLQKDINSRSLSSLGISLEAIVLTTIFYSKWINLQFKTCITEALFSEGHI